VSWKERDSKFTKMFPKSRENFQKLKKKRESLGKNSSFGGLTPPERSRGVMKYKNTWYIHTCTSRPYATCLGDGLAR